MKDLARLAFYSALTIGAILILIAMSKMDNLPSGAVIGTAMLLVVVLPVVIGIRAAKKERENSLK